MKRIKKGKWREIYFQLYNKEDLSLLPKRTRSLREKDIETEKSDRNHRNKVRHHLENHRHSAHFEHQRLNFEREEKSSESRT